MFVEREPLLATEMETLFVAGSEVYHKLRDRAKLGTTAASSVPIVLTGKKPMHAQMLFADGQSSLKKTVDSLGYIATATI